jgi:hypothetical protein
MNWVIHLYKNVEHPIGVLGMTLDPEANLERRKLAKLLLQEIARKNEMEKGRNIGPNLSC